MLIRRWNEASRALPVLALKSNYLDRWPIWPNDCFSQAFPSVFILQAIKNWRRERPGNEANTRLSPHAQVQFRVPERRSLGTRLMSFIVQLLATTLSASTLDIHNLCGKQTT